MVLPFVNLWHEWLWPVLQFVIGLGVVIFVHELGHFIVAKAVDIRVEQFALGFGTRLFGFKRGETDYRVNLIPMGGYVKLTGQEDFGPVQDGGPPDPRSFPNKKVSSRFAVIAAGVVMNVVLAAVLFIIVCMAGIRFPAPVVGGTLPGSPAEKAEIRWADAKAPVTGGLEPGDRILKVDGKPITRFNQLRAVATLADPDQTFAFLIERRRGDRVMEGTASLGVTQTGGTLHFGLVPAESMTMGALGDTVADDPFEEGDRVLAIGGQPIEHHWQIPAAEAHLDGNPVPVKILRGGREIEVQIQPTLRMEQGVFFLKDGSRVAGEIVDYSPEDGGVALRMAGGMERRLPLDQVVWPSRSEILDLLGLVPRLVVTGVVKDSPAYNSGIKPGDVVLSYGGNPTPTLGEFMRINGQVGESGATIEILRANRHLSLEIHPTEHQGRVLVGITSGPDLSNPVVGHIREGSPAAAAGMVRGGVFAAVNGKRVGNWIELFETLKGLEGKEIAILSGEAGSAGIEAHLGELTPRVFSPEDYRFVLFPGPRGFTILMGEKVKKNPAAAVVWGFRETWDFITMTYATLISYFRGTVSSREFSGPVGIGRIAIQTGREGVVPFIYFMAVISISLAVLNFLPIPVVDGGHAVFLIIEKMLGRPVPAKIQNAVAMVGWVLMILLFLALTWNDIARILGNAW